MELEVVAIVNVRRLFDRDKAGNLDVSARVDDAVVDDLRVSPRAVAEGKLDIEGVWIVLVGITQDQQHVVGAADDARNVFLEDARQIGSLPQPFVIGALMLHPREEEGTTPDAD